MTKEEFIQEAVLRMLSAKPTSGVYAIITIAEHLANKLFKEEKSKAASIPSDLNKIPIATLANDIDELDAEETKKRQERYPEHYRAQKAGRAVRVINVCRANDIKTIGDLLRFGRNEFLRQRNMGRLSVELTDTALRRKYNVMEW